MGEPLYAASPPSAAMGSIGSTELRKLRRSSMQKSLRKYLSGFDSIFTTNYDHNIENLVSGIVPVFHLHGSFDVLTESENPEYAVGYFRTQNGATVYQALKCK